MILWGVQLCKIEAKVFRLERKMVWKLNINRKGRKPAHAVRREPFEKNEARGASFFVDERLGRDGG